MKLHISAPVLAVCSFLLCCSDPPTSDPGTFWYRYNTAVVLEAGRTSYMVSSGLKTRDRAWVVFNTPDSLGANAGTVKLEDVELQLQDSVFPTQIGGYFEGKIYNVYSGFTALPLQLAGRLNTFIATGGPTVPALTISAPSPVREIAITSPLDDDVLSADSGFTVRWESSTQEGTVIEIRVWSLVSGGPFGAQFYEPLVPDRGSFLINAAALAGFPIGPIGISVRRLVRTTGVLADERRYDARIYTQRTIFAELR